MTKKIIPYSRQTISSSDVKSVSKILKTEFLTSGPTIRKFEKNITDYLGVKYAVAVNSATSALHISCLALNLNSKDYFWTSNNSFVASANCGLLCGAKPDLIDINLDDFNISIEILRDQLKKTKKKKLPKIIIPVHLAGYPANLEKLNKLKKKYKFKVIEDASHAYGSMYNGSNLGNCKYSDITVFSFHPIKIFTTGEGGVAVTNSKKIYEKLLILRNHGITKDPKKFKFLKKNPVYYEQQVLGLNYRLSDIHAALGLSQVKRLNQFYKKRLAIKKKYDRKLKGLPFIFPKYNNKIKISNHLYILLIDTKKTKKTRNQLMNFLFKKKITTSIHYSPIHMQPYYKKFKFNDNKFKNSIFYYKNAISLPIYPELSKIDQDYIILTIKKFFRKN